MSTQTLDHRLAQQTPISCSFSAGFRCCGEQLQGAAQTLAGVDVGDLADLAVVAAVFTNALRDGSAVVGDTVFSANRALRASSTGVGVFDVAVPMDPLPAATRLVDDRYRQVTIIGRSPPAGVEDTSASEQEGRHRTHEAEDSSHSQLEQIAREWPDRVLERTTGACGG